MTTVMAIREMFPEGSAVISPCQCYRYSLTRTWRIHGTSDGQGHRVLWVMLNPSTADGSANDPTIRKCVGFAKRWGAGAIEVVNLYAFRATDPARLREPVCEPVGPDNDVHIRAAIDRAAQIVCAWGANASDHGPRPAAVRRMLDEAGRTAHCLGRVASGSPRHPLMVAYATPLERYHDPVAGGSAEVPDAR